MARAAVQRSLLGPNPHHQQSGVCDGEPQRRENRAVQQRHGGDLEDHSEIVGVAQVAKDAAVDHRSTRYSEYADAPPPAELSHRGVAQELATDHADRREH